MLSRSPIRLTVLSPSKDGLDDPKQNTVEPISKLKVHCRKEFLSSDGLLALCGSSTGWVKDLSV